MSDYVTILKFEALETEIRPVPAPPLPECYMPSEQAHAFYRAFMEGQRTLEQELLYGGPGPCRRVGSVFGVCREGPVS